MLHVDWGIMRRMGQRKKDRYGDEIDEAELEMPRSSIVERWARHQGCAQTQQETLRHVVHLSHTVGKTAFVSVQADVTFRPNSSIYTTCASSLGRLASTCRRRLHRQSCKGDDTGRSSVCFDSNSSEVRRVANDYK